ncbi:hypothetical protein D3C72_1914950 [compost metagenome]
MGCVHHPDVGAPLDQPLNEFIFEGHFGAYGDVGYGLADSRQTGKQQIVPKSETSADGHGRPKAQGHADVLAGAFHSAHERGCEGVEGEARRGERRAGLVAHEQAAAELFLQCGDSGTDGRLRDEQPRGGIAEVSRRDDRQKRSGKFSIHKLLSVQSVVR